MPRYTGLFLLRAITKKGYRLRGFARICEWIRRFYIRRPIDVWVTDFDRDIMINVDLSGHIGSHIFWRGYHSRDELIVLERFLGQEHVFLDVGANLGEFTLFAAKRVRSGRIYAFEPVQGLIAKLSVNVQKNQFYNVRLINLALSDREGTAVIHVPVKKYHDHSVNDGMASLYGSGDGRCESILLTTLDLFVQREGPERIDFIKMDIEGAELSALRGAELVLQRYRPKIMIEINKHACNQAGYSPRDILAYLRRFGYGFQRIGAGGRLIPCDEDTLLDFQNVLCLPEGVV